MKLSIVSALALGAVLLASSAYAGDAEDKLIAKVVEGYGGKKLTNMKSIRIQGNIRIMNQGQGYTSDFVEMLPFKQDLQLDLVNQRGSSEGYSHNWNFTNHNRLVSVGEDIVNMNYQTNTYATGAAPDYYTAFGPTIRISDTLLAYELSQRPETATYGEALSYVGRPHETISLEIPNSPPLKLFVDSATGLISMMQRETPFGALTYHFQDHTTTNGVAYATGFEFFVGNWANNVTVSREVSVNTVRPSTFSLDRGMNEAPAQIDVSEMTVDKIADGVHHVGTGGAYTMFVDMGDTIIGVGGSAGLADRFTAYKEATGQDKPLSHQIATHHHTDHLASMPDALALGATIIAPAEAVANVQTAAGADLTDDRLVILEDTMDLGPVKIATVSTGHVEALAVVYVPSAKIVFQVDHYNSNLESGIAPANGNGATFKAAFDAFDLDIETILSGHGRKAVAWSDFAQAVADYDPAPCKSNRPICR